MTCIKILQLIKFPLAKECLARPLSVVQVLSQDLSHLVMELLFLFKWDHKNIKYYQKVYPTICKLPYVLRPSYDDPVTTPTGPDRTGTGQYMNYDLNSSWIFTLFKLLFMMTHKSNFMDCFNMKSIPDWILKHSMT